MRADHGFFLGVVTEFLKGVIKLLKAKINQLLMRSSKVGNSACIPASIAMSLQNGGIGGIGRVIALEQGGLSCMVKPYALICSLLNAFIRFHTLLND